MPGKVRRRSWPLLGLVLAAGPTCSAAAAAYIPPPPQVIEEELDEAVVEGQKLYQMRAAIVKAENLFYERYNELNPEKDYNVNCHPREKRTGTNLTSRVCRIQYVEKAQEAEARSLIEALTSGNPAATPTGPPAAMVALARQEDFAKNMLAVMREHPVLRQLADEAEELQRRYDKERKRRFKGRLIRRD